MKTKLPLAVARTVADQLISSLQTHARRIEVAGSIRRCWLEIVVSIARREDAQ